jgi:LysR family carnitine catabolism transcriptional activator
MRPMHKQSHMDSRRLEIFLSVVEEGGFSAAADALGMSQPAVSQAIRELETDLGALLFHRLGRGVALAPAGEALVLPARQARHDLAIGRAAVADVAGLQTGRLDLACLPTLAVAPLAPLVGAFRRSYPGISIVLSDPTDTAELLHFVRAGRSEIGITEAVSSPGLVTVPLGQQDFLVVLPPGTEVAAPLKVRQLAELPLVAAPPGASARALLDSALRQTAERASVVVEAAQREAILPLITAGAGCGLLPRPLAEVGAALGCVVVETSPPVTRPVALVHREGQLTPAAGRFVEMARAERVKQGQVRAIPVTSGPKPLQGEKGPGRQ